MLADWEADLQEKHVPNEAGTKKHGWPKWDDVIFSHMTPFAWVGRLPSPQPHWPQTGQRRQRQRQSMPN